MQYITDSLVNNINLFNNMQELSRDYTAIFDLRQTSLGTYI